MKNEFRADVNWGPKERMNCERRGPTFWPSGPRQRQIPVPYTIYHILFAIYHVLYTMYYILCGLFDLSHPCSFLQNLHLRNVESNCGQTCSDVLHFPTSHPWTSSQSPSSCGKVPVIAGSIAALLATVPRTQSLQNPELRKMPYRRKDALHDMYIDMCIKRVCYVYINIYLCVYIYMYMYIYLHLYVCIYIYICIYICIYIYMYIYICIHVYIGIYICIYVYIYVYAYVYIYMYMYICVCKHLEP